MYSGRLFQMRGPATEKTRVECEDGSSGTQSAPTWQISDAGDGSKVTWRQSIQNLVNQDRDFILNTFRDKKPV